MDQILRCKDTGFICNYVICGETKNEVLKKAREHAEFMHYKSSKNFLSF
jgi:predicted small metal-binding protein